jgi:hypothetical protein
MITFNVVRERHGWAVRTGHGVTTPYRSLELAIREANCLAEAIRRHGALTEVIIECSEMAQPVGQITRNGRALFGVQSLDRRSRLGEMAHARRL